MPRRRTTVRKFRAEKKGIEYKDVQENSYAQSSVEKLNDIMDIDRSGEVSSQRSVKKSIKKKKKTVKGKARFVIVVTLMMVIAGIIGIGIGKLMSLIF